MKKIRHLIWQIFGQPELPPRNFQLNPLVNQYTKKVYFPRRYTLVKQWQQSGSLEWVASINNVTRERVRQCIWKAYRENEMKG